jgi:gentisate 1,2-dioxygenase
VLEGEKLEWKQGYTFCLPPWVPYEHFAGNDTVRLYRLDDKPMLRELGFFRDETTLFTG